MAIKHTALHHKNTQNVSLRFVFHAAAKIHLFKQTLQFVLTRNPLKSKWNLDKQHISYQILMDAFFVNLVFNFECHFQDLSIENIIIDIGHSVFLHFFMIMSRKENSN